MLPHIRSNWSIRRYLWILAESTIVLLWQILVLKWVAIIVSVKVSMLLADTNTDTNTWGIENHPELPGIWMCGRFVVKKVDDREGCLRRLIWSSLGSRTWVCCSTGSGGLDWLKSLGSQQWKCIRKRHGCCDQSADQRYRVLRSIIKLRFIESAFVLNL